MVHTYKVVRQLGQEERWTVERTDRKGHVLNLPYGDPRYLEPLRVRPRSVFWSLPVTAAEIEEVQEVQAMLGRAGA